MDEQQNVGKSKQTRVIGKLGIYYLELFYDWSILYLSLALTVHDFI